MKRNWKSKYGRCILNGVHESYASVGVRILVLVGALFGRPFVYFGKFASLEATNNVPFVRVHFFAAAASIYYL
jgi:hypothetical protein